MQAILFVLWVIITMLDVAVCSEWLTLFRYHSVVVFGVKRIVLTV